VLTNSGLFPGAKLSEQQLKQTRLQGQGRAGVVRHKTKLIGSKFMQNTPVKMRQIIRLKQPTNISTLHMNKRRNTRR